MISTDALTGLKNRYSFEKRLSEIRKNKSDTLIAVIDVNNLKYINDNLGHSYGDAAIKNIGDFLKANMPDCDVYRIGGDEYIVICNTNI